ncbi:MAG: DUF5615 family PIN-like protein [Planctomycetales bacterium]|nr:DUF5615 family PIN-like protein [Planctomycetales bacterium]
MARLYANENFARPVVECLRTLGHDVLTVLEAGKAEQAIPDEEVLSFATSEQRCVITFNRKHFKRLHRDQPDHAGIVVCTYDPDFSSLAVRIDKELGIHDSLSGILIQIIRPTR